MNKEYLEIKIEEQNLVIQELEKSSDRISSLKEEVHSNEAREVLGLSLKEIDRALNIEEDILEELNNDLARFE